MKRFLTSRWGILLTIFTLVAVCKLSGHWELLTGLPVFGTVAAVPGHPDYTAATGSGKIPCNYARGAQE